MIKWIRTSRFLILQNIFLDVLQNMLQNFFSDVQGAVLALIARQ
jgi:hypothetical protein